MISCAARDRIAEWVGRGVAEGATLVVDGRDGRADARRLAA